MADNPQVFTANKANPPYWLAVLHTLQSQDPTVSMGGPLDNPLSAVFCKSTPWTQAQVTAAQGAIDGAPDDSPEVEAQYHLDIASVFERALLLTLLDQINAIRAALPTPLAAITPAQALAAVRAKAATL